MKTNYIYMGILGIFFVLISFGVMSTLSDMKTYDRQDQGQISYDSSNSSKPSRIKGGQGQSGSTQEDPQQPRTMPLNKITKSAKSTEKEFKVILNDPALSMAWGVKTANAIKAWEISKGSKNVLVAIIDTGADILHEDLQANIWTNPGETGLDKNGKDKATNGIDDDGNGYIDDVHGWNFVSNDNNLKDNHGHGTHIAGIIGAEVGNKKGIAGIAPNVSMMILKYFDPKVPSTDNLKNTIKAIQYATKMNAQVINYSGGGTEYSGEEKAAIEEAKKKNILFVAAAGNEKSNSDTFKYYPADYGLSNIISVTAIDPNTEVLPSSNYGTETVDIAAPGQNIISTLPGDTYGNLTGTSQATAFVTGAAVLFKAHRQIESAEEVKKYILASGDNKSSLVKKTRTSRQLNMFKALSMMDEGMTASGLVAVQPNSFREQVNSLNSNIAGGGKEFTNNSNQTENNVRNISSFGKSLLERVSQK